MQRLGIYSLLLSITSTLGAFNAGFSGSLVRYIAIFNAESKPEKAISLIGTLFSTLLVFFLILVILLNSCSGELIKIMNLNTEEAIEFEQLLLFASLVFLSGVLSGIFLSALEGLQKVYLKNYIASAVACTNLLLSIWLIPRFELKGLFAAYFFSNCMAYLAAWIFLQMQLKKRIFVFPFSWNKKLFRETFRYNFTFQIISVSSLFYDPLLRILLVRFEGLPLAGFYELANKMISQLRGVIVSVNQSLVPVFAGLENESAGTRLNLFNKSFRLIFILSNLAFGVLAAVLPFISLIWLGVPHPDLIAITLIVLPGWLLNTVALPVYFANIGFGKLKPVLYFHLVLAFIVPVFCFLSGISGLFMGVIFAWSAGLFFCSIPLILDFTYRNNIPLGKVIPKGFLWILGPHLVLILALAIFWKHILIFNFLECTLFGVFATGVYVLAYMKAGFIKEAWEIFKK